MKALIIEDNQVVCEFERGALEDLCFTEIDVAHSGAEALRLLECHQYDIVVADWMLPDTTGLQIARALRSSAGHRHTPIIMVTSKNSTPDILEALGAGVDDYIAKPMRPELLRQRVSKLLKLGA